MALRRLLQIIPTQHFGFKSSRACVQCWEADFPIFHPLPHLDVLLSLSVLSRTKVGWLKIGDFLKCVKHFCRNLPCIVECCRRPTLLIFLHHHMLIHRTYHFRTLDFLRFCLLLLRLLQKSGLLTSNVGDCLVILQAVERWCRIL